MDAINESGSESEEEEAAHASPGQAAGTAVDAVAAPAGNDGAPAAGKKKKKNKKKKKPGKKPGLNPEEFEAFCGRALALREAVPDELKLKVPQSFGSFAFTGALRPAYVTKQLRMPAHIAAPDHADRGLPIGEMMEGRGAPIHVYSPEEIVRVRRACQIGREVLDVARHFLKAGVTGDELDLVVYQACVERNAYPSPLNYHNFPKSLCVSPNETICHGIPDCRPVQDGDIVNLDVSVFVDGMHADLNETFTVGRVDEESRGLVKTSFAALQVAQRMIKPGTFYRDVGNEITRVARLGGCAVVTKYCGHGVGRLFHTTPSIPHYANSKAMGIMRPGHIFTIEPMLNLGPNAGDVTWPDGWTASTKDGRRSAQFEHTFLVTELGCEILTARPGTSKHDMVWDQEMENWLSR
jgi:methionyl aminopeptidase